MYLLNDLIIFKGDEKKRVYQVIEICNHSEQMVRNIAEPEFDIKIATAENSYLHDRKFKRYAKIK